MERMQWFPYKRLRLLQITISRLQEDSTRRKQINKSKRRGGT